MLTPAAAERDRREVLSIRKRLGIAYCKWCEQDTMPDPSGKCLWCDHFIVFRDDPEGEAA